MDSSRADGWGGRMALLVGTAIGALDGYRQVPIGGELEKVGDFVVEGVGAAASEGTEGTVDGSWTQFEEGCGVLVCVRSPDDSRSLSLLDAARAARDAVLGEPTYEDPRVVFDSDVVHASESEREPTVASGFEVRGRVTWKL